ncbi:MAG: hypothetical protein E6K72_10825 [Candidatus Eisenbacteria bacterium]|uniref:DUF4139 domain-containing protein n=1 Tax=Eiseniibacteriota bacterium TaxID=2212470 RepID=A0A538SI74_UNCEI|nr:MAG: hypothetical protein E6K72_10825 [Candidatus Eisenbacteria bacterium]
MSSSWLAIVLIPAAVVASSAVPGAATAAGPRVTIYTRDLGFVRETRTLDLGGARDTVRIEDVPARLDFSSARLAPAGDLKLTRLAWRYDVASGDVLIDRAVGRRVRVTSRGDRATEGTLVSADGSWLVVRADDGALNTVARQALETVRLANPAGDMALRPALEAVLEGGKRGRIQADLSYLTGGLSWSAEHVCVRRGESGATWSAGVTVQNETGRDFVDATLKLVAGEPRREQPMPQPVVERAMATLKMADAGGAALGEQAFADYHLYTLDRPATLRDRESQRLTLIEPRAVKVVPRYLYRGGAPGVAAQLVVTNEAASGLGVPLPAGRVRFYEADATGDLQFTGETSIAHTAEGEKLTLDVGQAFDLAAERHETRQRRISDREREYSVEIKLRNRKKDAVTIVVEESVGGDWEVLEKTHEFIRKDANTLEFRIPVAAGKETMLGYTARVRY